MGDVFISHSEQDEKLIRDIAASLRNIGLDVYVEEHETNYGSTLVDSVCEAIDEYDYFLVVLTKASVRSQWVNHEIGYAYAEEKDIIPVRVGNIKVSGMIADIKSVKSKSIDEEELISEILDFFVEELEVDGFTIECERCGDSVEYDLPEQEDYYKWDKNDEPIIFECESCDHKMRVNPYTLLQID